MDKVNSESVDNNGNGERSRLLWSCRRGMLELDFLLKDFIYNGYEDLEPHECKAFNDLLDYPDAVLFDLMMGKSITANQDIAGVVKKIRSNAAS